jgi:hypothetical protein
MCAVAATTTAHFAMTALAAATLVGCATTVANFRMCPRNFPNANTGAPLMSKTRRRLPVLLLALCHKRHGAWLIDQKQKSCWTEHGQKIKTPFVFCFFKDLFSRQ